MKLSRLGLMILPIAMVGMMACATGQQSGDTGGETAAANGNGGTEMAEPDFSNGPSVEASSNAYMRGDTVRVVAGTTVKVTLKSEGANSWEMANAPAAATLTGTGASAVFSWTTSEGDIEGSPYKVTFTADNGAGRILTIYVLRTK